MCDVEALAIGGNAIQQTDDTCALTACLTNLAENIHTCIVTLRRIHASSLSHTYMP